MFEVSAEWVKSHQSTKGGWNRAQLDCIEVKWPPERGWLARVVGRKISDEQKQRFEAMQGMTLKRKKVGQSRHAKPLDSPTPVPTNNAGNRAPRSSQTALDAPKGQ